MADVAHVTSHRCASSAKLTRALASDVDVCVSKSKLVNLLALQRDPRHL